MMAKNYYTRLSVNNSTVATIRHKAWEVVIPATFAWNKLASDLSDVRFVDAGGNNLDYWIEKNVYETEAVLWVRLPEAVVGTTVFYMQHSGVSGIPYQATSFAPHIIRPDAAETLVTFPKDGAGNNMPMLHPHLCHAPTGSWIAKSNAGSDDDVDIVMVNTAYTAVSHAAGWSSDLAEIPALYVRKIADKSWAWPTGYANWPQDDSGATALDQALTRVTKTGESCAALHPVGSESNFIIAPVSAAPFSDPCVVWLPDVNGGTLRVYFLYNSGYVLYYVDITSPTDAAWADAGGTSHLVFTPGIAQVVAGDFNAANACESEHNCLVSPSVIKDSTGYVLLIESTVSGPHYPKIVQRWTSSDGITWASKTLPTFDYPTPCLPQLYHSAVNYINDDLWLMTGSTGVDNVDANPATTKGVLREIILSFISKDRGATWKVQLPAAMPSCNLSGGIEKTFSDPYRASSVYVPGEGLVTAVGTKYSTNDDVNGTFVDVDSQWSPYYPRRQPNCSSTHWLIGLDFTDIDTLVISESKKLLWPIAGHRLDTDTTYVVSPDSHSIRKTDATTNGKIYFLCALPQDFRMRGRFAREATATQDGNTWMTYGNATPVAAMHRHTSLTKVDFRKKDNSYEAATTTEFDCTVPFTFDLKYLGSDRGGENKWGAGSSLQVLNQGPAYKDYPAQAITAEASAPFQSDGRFRYMTGLADSTACWLDIFYYFATLHFEGEAQATLSASKLLVQTGIFEIAP